MSTTVQLAFDKKLDLEVLESGVKVDVVRLMATVRFAGSETWSPSYGAIIDTGSPVSLIPYSVWQEIEFDLLLSKSLKLLGIGANEATTISGQLARVSCVLLDGKAESPELSIKAYLVENDSVPLLLGFEDVLTEMKLVSDYKHHVAYLEM